MTAVCAPPCAFHDYQDGSEPTLAPSAPSGLLGADYDVDLRRRHADCTACAGLGWVVQAQAVERVLCRREPPF